MKTPWSIFLLLVSLTVLVAAKHTLAQDECVRPGSVICFCPRGGHCQGSCFELSTCDPAEDGYPFCDTGGGVCCSGKQYESHNPYGESCKEAGRARQNEPVSLQSDIETAELVLVPTCGKAYRVREIVFGPSSSTQHPHTIFASRIG
jgi:hypothetical protein